MDKLSFTPFPIINSERLILRQATIADKEEIYFLKSNDNVLKYLDNQKHENVDFTEKFIINILKGIKNNVWIHWAINLKTNNKFIGTICIWNISEDKSSAEIGFELMPSYQGIGLMHEALSEVVKYGFQNLKVNNIIAYTHKDNIKSINLLKRNGFWGEIGENEYSNNYKIFRKMNNISH